MEIFLAVIILGVVFVLLCALAGVGEASFVKAVSYGFFNLLAAVAAVACVIACVMASVWAGVTVLGVFL
jgi:hypothetical protein